MEISLSLCSIELAVIGSHREMSTMRLAVSVRRSNRLLNRMAKAAK